MSGEKDLKKLLQSLSPELHSEIYVFCTLENTTFNPIKSQPIATFREKEGLSLVLLKQEADKHDLSYEGEFRLITLNVYSSLDAVGMTSAISKRLTEMNISANIIAAYHHDHLLVPQTDAERALTALKDFDSEHL